MEKLPKTRAAAKATGAAQYFTGVPCKHGHIAPRLTKGTCTECQKVEWQKSNDARAAYFTEYNKRAGVQEKKHAWYLRNKERVVASAMAQTKEQRQRYRKAWAAHSKDAVRANTRSRRKKHQEATPEWLTAEQKVQLRSFYKEAMARTRATGEQYVVDHIVPLRSKVVCGLHVPWNLQVITREENLKKSNKHA